MTTQQRIQALLDLGMTYNERTRSFEGKAGKIDHDVVIYHSDKDFEKKLSKLKEKK
jgi:hypothetical protein